MRAFLWCLVAILPVVAALPPGSTYYTASGWVESTLIDGEGSARQCSGRDLFTVDYDVDYNPYGEDRLVLEAPANTCQWSVHALLIDGRLEFGPCTHGADSTTCPRSDCARARWSCSGEAIIAGDGSVDASGSDFYERTGISALVPRSYGSIWSIRIDAIDALPATL